MWDTITDGVMRAATQVFGETVTYTPSGGSPVSKQGIFRSQYETVDAEGFRILTEQPNLDIRNSDFSPLPAQNDIFTIREIDYQVQTVHNDGDAGSTILLHEVDQ